jgi:hypothetical protein
LGQQVRLVTFVLFLVPFSFLGVLDVTFSPPCPSLFPAFYTCTLFFPFFILFYFILFFNFSIVSHPIGLPQNFLVSPLPFFFAPVCPGLCPPHFLRILLNKAGANLLEAASGHPLICLQCINA